MDYAYKYRDPHKLYLNVTNRCTNRCSFCVRYHTLGLGGAILWGGAEPDFTALQEAVGSCGVFQDFFEFVWCGYGEPTFRLDLMVEAAPWLRRYGARVRLNTNGHGCLIHGRDILGELAEAVDEVSVSLNAPTLEKYLQLCRPDPEIVAGPRGKAVPVEAFWEATLDFLARAPAYFQSVQASVVGFVLTQDEIAQCRALACALGITKFRVR